MMMMLHEWKTLRKFDNDMPGYDIVQLILDQMFDIICWWLCSFVLFFRVRGFAC